MMNYLALIISAICFVLLSCNVQLTENKTNDLPFGKVVETEGAVKYTFTKIDSFYCLRYIQFLPNKNFDTYVKGSQVYNFYDERRFNYELIKLEPVYETYFGKDVNYLYNYEDVNPKYNLRNSSLLTNHVVAFPYYSSSETYQIKGDEGMALIVAFNCKATLNLYINSTAWLLRDIEFSQNHEIDTANNCFKFNFLTEPNVFILNQCDSVWPLQPKQIKALNLDKSSIDSLPYGAFY